MADLVTRARRGETLRALGLMSGTSLDGIDLAVIDTDGEAVKAYGPWRTVAYDDAVREAVRAVLGATARSAATDRADRLVSEAHRDAVAAFLADTAAEGGAIDVIGFHGQTITHRPQRRFTWQIGDAAGLARALGVPVVGDFRTADVAAGGQGAPLVPVFHKALVHQAVQAGQVRLPVAVLNIGGVANVTWVGEDDSLLAFDTGPGNAPLDDWIRLHGTASFDEDGRLSSLGIPDRARIEAMLKSPYFSEIPPKSLDRNDFMLDLADGLSLADGAATLATACAAAAAAALRHMPRLPTAWIVSGGGARNPSILNALESLSNVSVAHGCVDWIADALEAQAFGFLAVRSLRGLPLSFPTTTGVPAALSGGRLAMP
jgi:anhydro-N-acetylmuramic acid kinase